MCGLKKNLNEKFSICDNLKESMNEFLDAVGHHLNEQIYL